MLRVRLSATMCDLTEPGFDPGLITLCDALLPREKSKKNECSIDYLLTLMRI